VSVRTKVVNYWTLFPDSDSYIQTSHVFEWANASESLLIARTATKGDFRQGPQTAPAAPAARRRAERPTTSMQSLSRALNASAQTSRTFTCPARP